MSRRRTVAVAVLTFLLTGLNPAPARAAHIGTKFGRGVANTTMGWFELPIQITKAKDDTAVLWIFTGIAEGLIHGVTRTAIGLWDLLTFFIPPYDSVLIDPETLLSEKPPPPKTED